LDIADREHREQRTIPCSLKKDKNISKKEGFFKLP